MKISFCTTCKNRLHHLKETLPANLRQNPDGEGYEVEFVVLNYGDEEGLHEWITTDPEMVAAMESGRLKYVRSEQPVFRMAHAKNMAHRMATGDVLCNLDADNYAGKNFAGALADFFSKHENAILSPSHRVSRHFPPEERGFFGRMALPRKAFEQLGGYDESFKGWGGEDTDLARRARLMGLKYYRFENMEYLGIIPHSNEARVANMFTTDSERKAEEIRITDDMHQPIYEKYFWAALSRLHTIAFKPTAANGGVIFGLGKIERGIEGAPDEIKPLRGLMAQEFNTATYVGGIYELYLSRTFPRYVQLKSDSSRENRLE